MSELNPDITTRPSPGVLDDSEISNSRHALPPAPELFINTPDSAGPGHLEFLPSRLLAGPGSIARSRRRHQLLSPPTHAPGTLTHTHFSVHAGRVVG